MRNLVIGAAALLLAACGGSDSGSSESEDGRAEYDVDRDGGDAEIRFTDNEGNETVIKSGSDVEAALPDGFTLYPGAEVVSNTTISGSEGNGVMVSISSSDPVEKLAAHYKSQAEAAGIDIQMEIKSGDTQMLGGEGDDGRFFSFNVSSEGDGSSGMLIVGTR